MPVEQRSTRRLYLDNAATSFPKPPAVLEAMSHYAQEIGANAGRGAYDEAIRAGTLVADCRRKIAQLLSAPRADSVVFTLNCTDALNLAIGGLIDPSKKNHIVCSQIDHNSVLRPIHELAARGWTEFSIVPCDGRGRLDPDDVGKAIRADTRLIVLTHASNVTGAIQPLREIAAKAQAANVPLLVDAAQTAAHVPIDVQADGIDLLACSGHKGLLGPLGTGVLYIKPGFEKQLRPMRHGGTGSQSELLLQPEQMPDRYESGSPNAIGIAGLGAAVDWILSRGVTDLERHEQHLIGTFLDGVDGIDGLRIIGPPGVRGRTGVFSVVAESIDPAELCAVLEGQFGILTRSGLHCAPLIHRALGTEAGGTVRLSFGPFLSPQDVQFACDALAAVTG